MIPLESSIEFDPDGLVPAVIQDSASGDVLMIGFMNQEALHATWRTGKVHYWSRGRQKLWRKGETSGHEQLVDDILINCELNSLLVKVRQLGAVCHEGYASCYFRRIEADGSLRVIRERVFDPAEVYGAAAADLSMQTKLWYGAYEFLRNNDLAEVSSTSHLLRFGTALERRIGDELGELAGVLEGTHTHAGQEHDAILEGSQVLYWVAVNAVSRNVTWDELRPDRALATADPELKPDTCVKLVRAEADKWTMARHEPTPAPQQLHAAIALVGQACRSIGIEPARLVAADIAAMRERPYLQTYFTKGETWSPAS